jgi:hypothetical protein
MTGRARASAATTAVVLALLTSSCSEPGPTDPLPTTTTEASTASPSPTPTPTPSPTPTTPATVTDSPSPTPTATDTVDLLLAQQIAATGVPFIRQPRCPEETPVALPAAFFVSFTPEDAAIALGERVALCLAGFDPALPVLLTVAVSGGAVPAASVTLASTGDDVPTGLGDRETLFDGLGFTASSREGSPFYQSPAWDVVPPDELRDALALAGEMSVEMRQGELAASFVQAVEVPGRPGHRMLTDDGPFAVWGFEPGLRVPVGLYERGPDFASPYTLVEEVGEVTMPLSRLALFDAPEEVMDLLREPGQRYRLWSPVTLP